MKILITTAGSHGDVLPFIALGRELAARGHEVVLFANPFFARHAAEAALRFVPISTVEAYQALFEAPIEGRPNAAFRRVAREIAELCPLYYRALQAEVVAGETLTIGNSLLFAARLLRETHGVPCATVHLAPAVFRSDTQPPRLAPGWIGAGTPQPLKRLAWWLLDRLFYEPHFTAPLNRFRGELGLPPLSRIFRTWVHEADVLLGLFPGWFAPPQPDWPAQPQLVGFPLYDHGAQRPLPPPLQQFLDAGPPPVAFSAGTATACAHRFFEASVEACRQAGLRGVLVSHFPQQVPRVLPEGVVHVDYAPFGALLPPLAAFVHHGGIGATSQALRAGVPQLIRPVAYDQFDNAGRAVALGVARELLPRHYSGRRAAEVLKALAGDEVLRQRCRQMAQRLAQDGDAIGAACDAILARLAPSARSQPLPAPQPA